MADEMVNLDQEKKTRVLAAAKELFGRFGFKKTTVDEIAENASISKRTIYEVFSSKEEILAELVMVEALSFRRFCLNQIKTVEDPVEKFCIFFDLSSKYFDENPFLGQVLADDAGLYTPFLGDEIHVVEEGMKGIIASILKEGIQKGVFRKTDVDATAQCILVLFRGFTYQKTPMEHGNTEWVAFILRAIAAQG
ncbi:MAG: TetR/AcrR family transcriptional regulator [Ardenticatenaceae bacterium]|nr:TetR/AcrR family transcriptional regulator [Ardenticatenaceae bacterium]HBY95405.1 hypothetical protein [Chloroflexota bacterium]